jgi:Ca2+-binding RTX toxin-like protein
MNGTSGNDKLFGTAGEEEVHAGAGNDQIYAEGGNDFVDGGDGDDYIVGGEGNDTLNGGAGNDEFVVYGSVNGVSPTGSDVIDGGAGIDTIRVMHGGSASYEVNSFTLTQQMNVERVIGSYYTDRLDASGVWTSVTIDGGMGNDTVIGGSADDTLYGGAGDDELIGGWGNDQLVGGSGDDTFTWDASLYLGTDTVRDFQGAGVDGGDVIRLANFTSFEDLAGRITQNGSDTFIDVNDGLRIVLVGVNADSLTAADFAFA